ncbi:MAG: glycosyltransferase family 4 protein [bacterium]
MRIVILSPVFPYPPADGDRIRIFNIIKELKSIGKHELHLVTFCKANEVNTKNELKKYFDTVSTVVLDEKKIIKAAVNGIFSQVPLNVSSYENAEMKILVKKVVEKHSPDLIYVYRLRMAQYGAEYTIPKVIDYVDSLALFMKRSVIFEKRILKKIYYVLDSSRVEKYERNVANDFQSVFINSEEDAQYLDNKNIITVPNGAMTATKSSKKKKNNVFTVGFMGNMPYGPNQEAVQFFINKVWKKYFINDKNIKLIIAGNGAERFSKLVNGGNVEFKKNVLNVEQEVLSWDMSVVPVRYGAGRQNKIMDSWACKVPVVAAPFAAKGVYGKDGYNILIAKNENEYAQKIKQLMSDPVFGKKIALNAKKTLKKYFDWKKSGMIINKVIIEVAKQKTQRKK